MHLNKPCVIEIFYPSSYSIVDAWTNLFCHHQLALHWHRLHIYSPGDEGEYQVAFKVDLTWECQ